MPLVLAKPRLERYKVPEAEKDETWCDFDPLLQERGPETSDDGKYYSLFDGGRLFPNWEATMLGGRGHSEHKIAGALVKRVKKNYHWCSRGHRQWNLGERARIPDLRFAHCLYKMACLGQCPLLMRTWTLLIALFTLRDYLQNDFEMIYNAIIEPLFDYSGVQSTLSKEDTLGTSSSCPPY